MTADLSALIARLEAAEVGSRELDGAIHDVLCDDKFRNCIAGLSDEQGGMWMYEFEGHAPSSALRVTQSLDAALALAERVLPEVFWEMSCRAIINGQKQYGVTLWPEDMEAGVEGAHGHAPTPALALVIAILRAKQGEPA